MTMQKGESRGKTKKEVKCDDYLFIFSSSCGSMRGKVGTTGREPSVLDSYSLYAFLFSIVVCFNKIPLTVLVHLHITGCFYLSKPASSLQD